MSITVAVSFSKNVGQPATGLALADIDLYLTQVDSSGVSTVIWDGSQNPTSEVDNIGVYLREYAAADLDLYSYFVAASYTGAESLDSDYAVGWTGTSESAAIASAVWANTTRTLTQSAAQVTSILTGTTLTLPRGDTWSISLTGLGSIADYAHIDFVIKLSKSAADTAALVWIRKSSAGGDGLKVLAGSSSVTASNGSITIDDQDDGDITIALKATDTAGLTAGTYSYDIQKITAAGVVTTLTSGTFVLPEDVGRATS